MSGDMCTSLGNGFTNLMVSLFALHEAGVDLTKVCGHVEGDDGIFSAPIVPSVNAYASVGFDIKLERIESPETASFCGIIYSQTGDLLRDPLKFIRGFGWTGTMVDAGRKVKFELLRAKALSAMYETPNCPIVGALAYAAYRMTMAYSPRYVDDGYHRPPRSIDVKPPCPSEETRMLFARLYGIDPKTQRDVESAALAGDKARLASLLMHLHGTTVDIPHWCAYVS
jgi:hypothetical protein